MSRTTKPDVPQPAAPLIAFVAALGIVAAFSSAAGAPDELIYANSFELPVDPAMVAPPLKQGVPYDIGTETRFLYLPPNQVQFGVDPNDIDPLRVAVLRGLVMDSVGNPLGGVRVSVLDHPEFGFTLSRTSGRFDMAVNGGGPLTLSYSRDGLLPAQRTVDARSRDFVNAPDVALLALSARVDTVGLTPGAPIQIARGEMINDSDGNRQATIMFPEGTSAEMLMPGGVSMPLTTLNVRATEYTVGDMGRMAMPARLPAFTEYTYAVELSVDEAMTAGASMLNFSQPLPFYLENYLGLAVGGAVPSGFYDRDRAAWIPSEDGIVLRVLDTSGGAASIDFDGDDQAEAQSELLDFGFTLEELQQLAQLYNAGQTLWRVPIRHFTPYDLNLPPPPPPENPAPDPIVEKPQGGAKDGKGPAGPKDLGAGDPCEQPNSSFISCQLSTVSERLVVPGTPFSLIYRSDRTAGRVENRRLNLRLVRQVPQDPTRILTGVDLTIEVAGQRIEQSFSDPRAGLSYQFEWDGRDAYGRPVRGSVPVTVTAGYVYETVYCAPRFFSPGFRSFGGLCPADSSEVVRVVDVTGFTRVERTSLTAAAVDDVAGWTLDVHHSYDPVERALYRGDGALVQAPAAIEAVIESVIGGGGSSDDGIPADQASLGFTPWGVDVGSDGSVYLAIESEHRIRKVGPDGIITTIAGQRGSSGFSGDRGAAVDALLDSPQALALGPDDSVYFVDSGNGRVRKIDPDGTITTIAGGGAEMSDISGRLATDISLQNPFEVEVARDGAVYTQATNVPGRNLIKISGDGRVTALPGFSGSLELTADGVPMVASSGCIYRAVGADRLDEACFVQDPEPRTNNFALAADGSMFFVDHLNGCVKRFDAVDAIASPVASENQTGDITVQFRPIENVGNVLVGRDLRTPTFCSEDFSDPTRGDGGPSASGWTGGFIPGMSFASNGDLYLVDVDYFRVRRIRTPFKGFDNADIIIPADESAAIFRFDGGGRHLQTLSSLTGAVLVEFDYDADGRLLRIRDESGNETTIERSAGGESAAIVAPLGQRTTLTVNPDGYLATFSNPANEAYGFGYTPEGLVTAITDPAGNTSSYLYSDLGELETATAADGYQQSLAKRRIAGGFEITRTTGLGRTSIYSTAFNEDRDLELANTDESGAETVVVHGKDNTTTTTRPSGTLEISGLLPDQQFGLQRPGGEVFELDTPAGKSLKVTTQMSVVLSDPDNPLSVQSLTETRSTGSRTRTTVYDADTRTITATSPTGRISTTVIDEFGRIVSARSAPDLAEVSQEFDARGLLTRRNLGSEFTEYVYDSLGRLVTIRNPAGQENTLTYDLADRPLTMTTPGNRTYTYGYDLLGRVTSITMPNGSVHTMDYALDGQLESYAAPGADPLRQVFDLDRRRNSAALPDGRTQIIGFDARHRLSTISYPEAEVSLGYAGSAPLITSMTRSPTGSGPDFTVSYTYDGDIVSSTTIGSDVFSFRHDNDLRLGGVQLNAEPEWTFVHDDDDLVTGYGPFTITRDGPAGAPGAYTDGTLLVSYTFDDLGRLTARSYEVNDTPVYAVAVTFETGTGRIEQRAETVLSTDTVQDYTYSPEGELMTVNVGANATESYAYDVNGNRTIGNGSAAAYDAQDRMLTNGLTAYVYDSSGFLAASGDDLFTYSTRGELLSADLSNGDSVAYGYDALARRVSRSDASGTTRYLYGDPNDPLLMLASRAPDNTLTRYFYDEAGVLIALDRGGNRFYVAADQVGTPKLVIDAAGSVVKALSYDSFGVLLSDSNPGFDLPLGFAGGLNDPATGLVRFGFRDYEPASGRWTARDPLLFNGGQLNLYAYANSNPVSLRDPTGLFCIGYSYYAGYGGGGKFCFGLDGNVQACAEVGLGAGGGASIDLTGSAKAGYSDYAKAEAGLGCGPVSFGASASVDNCGNAKVCGSLGASLSSKATFQEKNNVGFKAGGSACYNFLTKETTVSGPLGASIAGKEGSSPARDNASATLPTVNFGGKVQCKVSAGAKAGVCYGKKIF